MFIINIPDRVISEIKIDVTPNRWQFKSFNVSHLKENVVIAQRYVFAFVGLLGTAVVAMLRLSLNIAISHMANMDNSTTSNGSNFIIDDACPGPNAWTNESTSQFDDDKVYPFDWNEGTTSHLLIGYHIGYISTQFFGGMLSESLGGKPVLGFAMLISSTSTFIAPLIIKLTNSSGLYILRYLTGFGSGPNLPALMNMLSFWAPETERARMGAITYSGIYIGNIAGNLLGKLLLRNGNWEAVFYVFGTIGYLWIALWYFTCYSSPNKHPRISNKEKEYLNENVNTLKRSCKYDLEALPWSPYLRSITVWVVVVAAVGHEWGDRIIFTHLPQYVSDILRSDILSSETIKYLSFLTIWVSVLCFGFLCDFGVKRGFYSTRNGRKIYTSIAAFGPAICVVVTLYSNCNTTLAVLCYFVGTALMGAYYSGMLINPLDITPNYCGTMIGIIDNIAINSALLVPYFINYVVPDSTFKQWTIALWACVCIMVVTNIINIIFGKGEQLWWDDVRKHGYPKNWTHGLLSAKAVIDVDGVIRGRKLKDEVQEKRISENELPSPI